VSLVPEDEPAGVGEAADDGSHHVLAGEQGQQFVQVFGWDGQGHAFLCLGDPDLLQVDLGPEFGAHFADAGRQAAGPAVGQARVQTAVAGHQKDVGHLLLDDGVADLDGVAELVAGRVRQFAAREGGAVDAVASRPPAHDDDQVAGLLVLEALVPRQEADVAAVDQRVAEIPVVEVEGPVGRRDAHAVPVVADAADDAAHDPLGVQDAGRQLVGRVGRADG